MVPPMAATVAWVDPETAPKSVQLALVVIGRPPGRWPTKGLDHPYQTAG